MTGRCAPPGARDTVDELSPLREVERAHVERVLHATQGNKTRAAEILEISRPRLNRLLQRHGLE